MCVTGNKVLLVLPQGVYIGDDVKNFDVLRVGVRNGCPVF